MKKTMTLRGTIEYADNARSLNNKIFEYESNDLTSAWKVTKFLMWPAGVREDIATTEGQMMFVGTLATDTVPSIGFNDIGSVEDNRFIGWIQRGFNVRNEGTDDFLAAPTGMETNYGYVDPDHLVNDALFIHSYNTKDGTTNPDRKWNYIVELQRMKINETQAILAIVKGRAQDIDN
jgi:hypothetical protein